jgi:asparagine synthase (glutamine-hydrolysing)
MSDFLVSIGKNYQPEDLLALVKRPYGERAPEGQCFDFGWGTAAVLKERIAYNKNIVTRNRTTLAWVGDLVTDMSNGYIDALISRIENIRDSEQHEVCSLESDEIFKKLNGAFAIVLFQETGFSIVTDLLNYTQVYAGQNKDGTIASVGTQPDIVAGIGDCCDFDTVSLGEYLNSGRATFPNTMYLNVKQLEPGSLYIVSAQKNGEVEITGSKYWSPPKELTGTVNENELAADMRKSFLSAVEDRSVGKKVAVSLSGGLDSRLIIASVPRQVDCIALTFCDEINREARTARKIAKCFGRPWYPLYRDKEYVGDTAVQTIRLTGCESDWVHAHGVGFAEAIESEGITELLSGTWVGCFLRAYCAEDWNQVKHAAGILPAVYKKTPYEYVDKLTPFSKQHLSNHILKQIHSRRQIFYEKTVDLERGSIAEWLEVNPITQGPEIAEWSAERRLLPMRLVGADRRLLDIAFKTPTALKLGNRIFFMAAMDIYGKAAHIPSANDGVRPGSGHWWRLLQRAVRKFQDRTTRILEKLGKEPKIQHSWHDYPKYWRESGKLRELIREYGANLEQFDGILFKESGQDLLVRKDLHWQDGFRLLQLAVWKGLVKDYKPGK